MIKFFPFYSILFFFSCSEPLNKPDDDPFHGMTKRERKSALENALTRASKKEQLQISGYLKRHQIPAIKTETGIHYCIYENGNGNLIKDGQIVTVDYVITKINGEYAVSKAVNALNLDEPNEFIHFNVESHRIR